MPKCTHLLSFLNNHAIMQKSKIAHSISTLNTTIQDYMLDHKSSGNMYYYMQLVFVSFIF